MSTGNFRNSGLRGGKRYNLMSSKQSKAPTIIRKSDGWGYAVLARGMWSAAHFPGVIQQTAAEDAALLSLGQGKQHLIILILGDIM